MASVESYRIDSFGYLEIEFEKNQISYLYEYFLRAIRTLMRAERPHLARVFRLVRMSYELNARGRISNISTRDVAALEMLVFDIATSQLWEVINWAQAQNLPNDSEDYVLVADQTAKNVSSVIDG